MTKYSYRVVIRTDDRKEKGKLIDMNEYYVSGSIDKVYEEAKRQTKIHEGELIAIIRQDPIIKVYK